MEDRGRPQRGGGLEGERFSDEGREGYPRQGRYPEQRHGGGKGLMSVFRASDGTSDSLVGHTKNLGLMFPLPVAPHKSLRLHLPPRCHQSSHISLHGPITALFEASITFQIMTCNLPGLTTHPSYQEMPYNRTKSVFFENHQIFKTFGSFYNSQESKIHHKDLSVMNYVTNSMYLIKKTPQEVQKEI